MIEQLQACDPEAECYYGMFDGFLTDDMKWSKEITEKEGHTVYPIDFEEKSVYDFCVRTQSWITYTGVIFE
jgi:hypothetical protein